MIEITTIILLIFGVLQIILFFKIWGMCNDVRELKKEFVKEKKSHEIKDIDSWLEGGSGREGERTDDDKIFVGSEVSSTVDKNGVHMGDVLKVTKVAKDHVVCSLDGKNVGKFSLDEIFIFK